MAYTSLSVEGYRGFSKRQMLEFAVPNGMFGGGLTFIVGPNNSGKSSILECIHSLLGNRAPQFHANRRNSATDGQVVIELIRDQSTRGGLRSGLNIGGTTEWYGNAGEALPANAPHPESYHSHIFVLPSRRHFQPAFGDNKQDDRAAYMGTFLVPDQRGYGLQNIAPRLLKIHSNRQAYEAVLAQVINPVPRWGIERSDRGGNQLYVSVKVPNGTHDTDGLGEGILNAMLIVDALYDSKVGDMIVIDEPELSLHPALQKKLGKLLKQYSRDRQIVIATHSPYFVDWESIFAGSRLARVHKREGGIQISALSQETVETLKGLVNDRNNPHVLGLQANEVFFQEDPIVLVEGQEDVIFYPLVLAELQTSLPAEFFGWGVGGANKMQAIAQMLHDLGFNRVIGLLDNNKANLLPALWKQFPSYYFMNIPADDIRTKSDRTTRATVGLLDERHKLRPEYKDRAQKLFVELNAYLKGVWAHPIKPI